MTIKEYYQLPDDQRVELIDGKFYEMETPPTWHQSVLGDLLVAVANYIKTNHAPCHLILGPVDVQLDEDIYTMVQPDLLVVCDERKVTERCVVGAPDFVVEILSPSTKEKDAFLKTQKYFFAGVKEYWMVDWEKERVIVYCFEEDDFPVVYGFGTPVPVWIFKGELEITLVKDLWDK